MTLHHVAVAAKDGQATPVAIPGGIRQHDVSGTGAGPNVPELVIADSTGAEVLGTTADPAVTTDVGGSAIGFLRGLVKLFASITFKAASTAPLATDPALVVAISPNSVNTNGQKAMAASAPVVIASDQAAFPVNATGVDQYAIHKEVGAGATATVLGATGVAGDYLAYVTVFPGAAACGVVTILDGTNVVGTFAGGGTTVLPSLVPFVIPIGAFCTGAGWHITTGANVTVTAIGKFT